MIVRELLVDPEAFFALEVPCSLVVRFCCNIVCIGISLERERVRTVKWVAISTDCLWEGMCKWMENYLLLSSDAHIQVLNLGLFASHSQYLIRPQRLGGKSSIQGEPYPELCAQRVAKVEDLLEFARVPPGLLCLVYIHLQGERQKEKK
jgi:hypothetical protein